MIPLPKQNADGSYTKEETCGEPFSAHAYFMHNPSLSGRGSALNASETPDLTLEDADL